MIRTQPETQGERSSRRGRCLRGRRPLLAGFLLTLAGCRAQASSRHQPDPAVQERASYTPPAGFVPTADVAIQIAHAVLVPIYGIHLDEQLPLTAQLDGELWIVQGTLPQGWRGGIVQIEISKRDGRISHLSGGR